MSPVVIVAAKIIFFRVRVMLNEPRYAGTKIQILKDGIPDDPLVAEIEGIGATLQMLPGHYTFEARWPEIREGQEMLYAKARLELKEDDLEREQEKTVVLQPY